jgi:hypothetical protein
MKLILRIARHLLPKPGGHFAVYRQFDTGRLFPHLCSKEGKWFRGPGDLFRRNMATKYWRQKAQ